MNRGSGFHHLPCSLPDPALLSQGGLGVAAVGREARLRTCPPWLRFPVGPGRECLFLVSTAKGGKGPGWGWGQLNMLGGPRAKVAHPVCLKGLPDPQEGPCGAHSSAGAPQGPGEGPGPRFAGSPAVTRPWAHLQPRPAQHLGPFPGKPSVFLLGFPRPTACLRLSRTPGSGACLSLALLPLDWGPGSKQAPGDWGWGAWPLCSPPCSRLPPGSTPTGTAERV